MFIWLIHVCCSLCIVHVTDSCVVCTNIFDSSDFEMDGSESDDDELHFHIKTMP